MCQTYLDFLFVQAVGHNTLHWQIKTVNCDNWQGWRPYSWKCIVKILLQSAHGELCAGFLSCVLSCSKDMMESPQLKASFTLGCLAPVHDTPAFRCGWQAQAHLQALQLGVCRMESLPALTCSLRSEIHPWLDTALNVSTVWGTIVRFSYH